MRGTSVSLLIILFLLSLGCTSVKVEVKYAEGPTSELRMFKPPLDPNQLPKRDPTRIGGPSCPGDAISQKVRAIPQKTDAWCWAASTQTIMEAHDTLTQQCNIVESVYQDELTTDCCGNATIPGECWRNGWPEEAFNNFGFNWEYVEVPLKEDTLAGQLCQNGPFIFVLEFEGGGGHTFVVKDIDFIRDGSANTGQLFLWVYDQEGAPDPQDMLIPTDFKLWSYDAYVEGLWNGGNFKHALDYVQISPME